MILKRLSLPIQLLLVIVGVMLFGDFIPLWMMRGFYTGSLVFKEFLSFMLPFIIFSFVITGILSIKRNGPLVLGVLIGSIFISNIIVAMVAYGVIKLALPWIASSVRLEQVTFESLSPYFTFKLPQLIRSEYALISAMVLGIFYSYFRSAEFNHVMYSLRAGLEKFLLSVFIPLLPVYVFGFLLKMKHDQVFTSLFQHYTGAFIIIVATQIVYLLFLYALANNFVVSDTIQSIKHALPSYFTAFGTMSSAMTVPVTTQSAIKNTDNKALSHLAVPIMANVHLLGDSIITPILTLMTLLLFNGTMPTFPEFFSFILYFGVAMFAVSGIPGGGILVMVPLLVSLFGFTPAMVSLIISLYLLLDCFGTAANVMGDGALIIIVHKLLKKIGVEFE
jgi:Na+/H+-dicarboxylate symporter